MGGKGPGSLMKEGRRTGQHKPTSSKDPTWLQTLLKLLFCAQGLTQKAKRRGSGSALLCYSEAPHELQGRTGESWQKA